MNKLAFLAVFFLIGLGNSLPLNEEEENANDNQIQSRATVCYDDPIGCFSNDSPWDNALGTLPVDPSELKTEFLLFTRKNPLQEQLLHYKDPESIRSSNFDTTLPLKIIIHGFDNTRETKWLHTMKRTILDTDNVNVMIVGWGNGSAFPYYNNATANIRMVGRELGLLINLIREILFSSNPKNLNIHCIGHSLGSHTCAYGSNNAKIKFNRISAMDPAGPSFEDTNPIIRVDPTDADFVDVMHTNGGSIISASFGMNMVCGHVDFYVNGGKNQPGCPTGLLGGVLDPNGESSCSHSRAYQFYTESISSKCPFTSYTCYSESDWVQGKCTTCANNKCAVMGYWADKYPGRGSVYLATNAQTPFCGHHHIFEMTLASDSPKTAGEIAISFPFSNIDSSYKPLTTNDDNLVANNVVRRVFVTQNDLSNVNHMTMKFNKKPKPLIGQDQNAALLKFTEIQVHSVDLRESYTECAPDVRTLETNKTIDVNIRYKC